MASLVSNRQRCLCSETRTQTPGTHQSLSRPHGGFLTESLSRESLPAGLVMVVFQLTISVMKVNLFKVFWI